MKIIILLLYIFSALLAFSGLIGGSLTESIVKNYSEEVIAELGIDKSRIDSLDSQIDFVFNTVNTVLKKLENIKDVITFNEADIQPVRLIKNKYIQEIVYEPIVSGVSLMIRIVLFVAGIFLLAFTALIHTIKSYTKLRKRVRILENKFAGNNSGIPSR